MLGRSRPGTPEDRLEKQPVVRRGTAGFNLSASRHRPLSREKAEHRDPLEILEELRGIETQILGEIGELAEAVRKS